MSLKELTRSFTVEQPNFKNILVVRTDRIGDVVLTTPALEALRRAYPKAKISLMVASATAEIVEGNPFIDEVIIYDKNGKDKGFVRFWRFVAALRQKHFDLAINYHLKSRMNWMLFHADIPCRIGFRNNKFGFLLTAQYPDCRAQGNRHESEYCLDLLRQAGIRAPGCGLFVSVKPEAEAWADKILKDHRITPTDLLVAVHPGASCLSKRWPPERFAEAADRLIARDQAKIILIGASRDLPLAQKILKSMEHPVLDLVGKTTISRLISILKRCKLLVSNDSGPVHLSVGVKTPVISIFGRHQPGLSPSRWRPLGSNDVALHKDVGCKVCRAHRCERHFECLAAISVDHVLEAAQKILREDF